MTYQQYLKTPWSSSLDSLEGVPDLDVFSPRVKPEERNTAQRWAHESLTWLAAVTPGILMAPALAWLGKVLSEFIGKHLPYQKSPISPIMLAVLLGLIIRNTIGVPKAYESGLRLCLKT